MFRWLIALLALGLLLGPVRAQDATVRAILERAIEAHGGTAQIDKRKAVFARAKSTLHMGQVDVPAVIDTYIQLPDRFKSVMVMDIQGQKLTMIQCLNGGEAWIDVNGQPQQANDQILATLREFQHHEKVVRLTPLLRDKGFEFRLLGAAKVGDHAVIGVKVIHKDFEDINLFFDKATGLLLKTEHKSEEAKSDGSTRKILKTELFSDFKEIDGVKRPMKVVIYHDDQKFLEGEITEVKPQERLDDSVFTRP